jgi:hypothetical protein
VKRPLAIGGLVLAAVAGLAWGGVTLLGGRDGSRVAVSTGVPDASEAAPSSPATNDSTTVEVDGQQGPVDAGITPMKDRVAVLGLLNKRNGVSRDVTMKPGQTLRVGDVVIRLQACEKTAPWEPEQLTGAFVQLDVQGVGAGWKRVFSGWLYKERPSYNVVLHPVYDVWTKSCATTFPGTAPSAPAAASSAPKAAPAAQSTPSTNDDEEGGDDAVVESAPPNNAM